MDLLAQSSSSSRNLDSEVGDQSWKGWVTSMFAGAWCGQSGVIGWVLMGLFWVTFLGLVLWAISRLFAPTRVRGGHAGDDREADGRDADARGQRTASEVTACPQPSANLHQKAADTFVHRADCDSHG